MDPRNLPAHTATLLLVLLVVGAAVAASTWNLDPLHDDRPLHAVGADDATAKVPDASRYVTYDDDTDPDHVRVHAEETVEGEHAKVLVSLEKDPATGAYVLTTAAADQEERFHADVVEVHEAAGLVEVLVQKEGDTAATPLITVEGIGTDQLSVIVAENPVNRTETAVVDLKAGIVTIVESHHEVPLDDGVAAEAKGVRVEALNGSTLLDVDTEDDAGEGNGTHGTDAATDAVTSTIGTLEQKVEDAQVRVENLPGVPVVVVKQGEQERLRVTLRAGDGSTPPRAEVIAYDRDGAVLHHAKVSGPVEVVGPVDDPRGLRVFHPEGGTLLELAATASGGWQLQADGEQLVLPHDALRIEGNPLGPGDVKLHVTKPTGERATYTVNRGDLEGDAAGAVREQGQDPTPVVEVLEELEDPPGFFTHLAYVINGNEKQLQPNELTGDHWISGRQDTVFAARVADPSPYDRVVVRYEAGSAPEPGDPQVLLEDTGTVEEGGRWYESPGTNLPGTASKALHFEVLYEVSRTPFIVVAQRDDLDGTPYKVRVDDHEPTSSVTAPGESDSLSFTVSWSGADEGSGVDTYHVQKRAGNGPWETWLPATTDTHNDFTGEDGTTYTFRVRAVDAVGHVGDWSNAATTVVNLPDAPAEDGTAGDDDGNGTDDGTPDDGATGTDPDPTVNEKPQVRFLQPSGGQEVAGVVTVKWSASDPDGTTPGANLEVSGDGGQTWTTLAASKAGSTTWDTRDFDDGDAYELRITVTDGSLSNFDQVSPLTVNNVRPLADASNGDGSSPDGGSSDGGSPSGDGGGSGSDRGVPAAGVAATLLASLGGAAMAGRRRCR